MARLQNRLSLAFPSAKLLAKWFKTRSHGFAGSQPIQVIERGEEVGFWAFFKTGTWAPCIHFKPNRRPFGGVRVERVTEGRNRIAATKYSNFNLSRRDGARHAETRHAQGLKGSQAALNVWACLF